MRDSQKMNNSNSTPSLDVPTPDQKRELLAMFKTALTLPNLPVPEPSLRLLFEAAAGDTGGGQAARYFLFWLAGRPDPTGFVGDGGLELRRFDGQLKAAAIEVLQWWAGPVRTDQPLYDLLHALENKFSQP